MTGRWRIDEMGVKVGGETRQLWQAAVDDEGVLLDSSSSAGATRRRRFASSPIF